MNPSENKALYRRFIEEVFNQGRLDRVAELLAPSYVFHYAPPGTPNGSDGVKQTVTMFRAAFPDLNITFEEQVAEGDKVCSRTVMRGTHRGGIFGVPPSGRSVAMPGMT